MELMQEHYKKDTIEIAERFKFFKRVQQEQETLANYLAELRKLAKHCNFGNYLDTALRDQLVCGLRDRKTQRELLCTPNLTLAMASEKARATETAIRETQQLNPSPAAAHNLAQHRRGGGGNVTGVEKLAIRVIIASIKISVAITVKKWVT